MELKKMVSRIIGKISCCPLCHETADGLCASCLSDIASLKINTPVCPLCAESESTGSLCGYCQTHLPYYDALFASYDYQMPINRLIHQWKYHHHLHYFSAISSLMVNAPPPFLQTEKIDYLLPVPQSTERYLWRGFHPAGLLAEALSSHFDLPLFPMTQIHRAHRPAQSQLNREQRLKNLKDVFSVEGNFAGKTVLLIDDVKTTGATLNELSKSLKSHKVSRVFSWVLLRQSRYAH